MLLYCTRVTKELDSLYVLDIWFNSANITSPRSIFYCLINHNYSLIQLYANQYLTILFFPNLICLPVFFFYFCFSQRALCVCVCECVRVCMHACMCVCMCTIHMLFSLLLCFVAFLWNVQQKIQVHFTLRLPRVQHYFLSYAHSFCYWYCSLHFMKCNKTFLSTWFVLSSVKAQSIVFRRDEVHGTHLCFDSVLIWWAVTVPNINFVSGWRFQKPVNIF